jgi:hypothetical protein
MNKTIALALMVVVFGCKKDGKSSGKGAAAAGLPESVTAAIPTGAAAAFNGAWKGRMTLTSALGGSHSMAGDPAAFDIKGDAITVFDGKADHAMPFEIESPCTIRIDEEITEGSMKGGTSFHTIQYVIKDGKALLGDGGVGFRKGKSAVFCTTGMDGGVYTLDDKGLCTHWKDKFGKWDSTEGICTWSSEEGKDVLTVGSGNWSTKLIADGDALMSDQFKDETKLYEKTADFAAAKAAVTAKLKADDPGEQAKAAGGKPGDMTTIVGLIATYAADKSLKGKPLEITAQYLNSNSSSSGDQHSYNAILVDSKDSTSFSLTCETKAEVTGFTQYDKVIAKGTIDESFNKPSLKDCTITKAP